MPGTPSRLDRKMSALPSDVQAHGQSQLSIEVKRRKLLTRVPARWRSAIEMVEWLKSSVNTSFLRSAVILVGHMQKPVQLVSRRGCSTIFPVRRSCRMIQKLHALLVAPDVFAEKTIRPSPNSNPISASFMGAGCRMTGG